MGGYVGYKGRERERSRVEESRGSERVCREGWRVVCESKTEQTATEWMDGCGAKGNAKEERENERIQTSARRGEGRTG